MNSISRIILAVVVSFLTHNHPLFAQTGIDGGEKQQALTLELRNTLWAMQMLDSEKPWGELLLSQNGRYATTSGPNGKWNVREKLTVGLDDEFLIRILPNKTMDVFGKGGRKIATGTQTRVLPIIVTPHPSDLAKPHPIVVREARAETAPELRGRYLPVRSDMMKKYGMKAESELAVTRGLNWLRDNQKVDGSWGDKNMGAMTGFALLCFLGHGEMGDSPQYGLTVNKAIQWIIDNGTISRGRLSMESTFTQSGVYEHGIATLALAEYYAMTKDERVLTLLNDAISYIVKGQGPDGGWMYAYDKTQGDTSVSGWQFQALYAAHLTGLKLPSVEEALDRAIVNFNRVRGEKGGFGYRKAEDRYSLTGIGILSNLMWKGSRDKVRVSMDWMLTETKKNKEVKYNGEYADLYAWYYHTSACAKFGGTAWSIWNTWLQDEIPKSQSADGSWPIPGGKSYGPTGESNLTGKVYRTALCILMLESPYRIGRAE